MQITIEMLKGFALFVGVPVARSITGWAQKALKDGKITKFEIKKLIETVIRTGVMSVALYFGINELGIDLSPLAATISVYVGDVVFSAIKKLK